jgi:hypothetical protein
MGDFMKADLPDAIVLSVLIRHFTRVIEQLASKTAMPTRSTDLRNRLFPDIATLDHW